MSEQDQDLERTGEASTDATADQAIDRDAGDGEDFEGHVMVPGQNTEAHVDAHVDAHTD